MAINRRDKREPTVACLRVLQAALVYVNTLILQDVLADPAWTQALTVENRRGLTPLSWSHVAPYGEVRLDHAQSAQLVRRRSRRPAATTVSTALTNGLALQLLAGLPP